MSTTNASIPAKNLPDGVNEAAVMEALAENPYIAQFFGSDQGGSGATLEKFAEYCKNIPDAAQCAQVQILNDYLSRNEQAGSYQILNVDPGEGKVGNKILICTEQADGSSAYFVGFQGTQDDEWYDNAEGMTQLSTLQQRDAANYFDSMVAEFGITDQDAVIVTGHSKGGNKAQYVTLAAQNADLVDSCIALDGQGFSPEAVAMWEKYPDVYQERREKIILVAGENDYVHVLGVRVATDDNTYYVCYDNSSLDVAAHLGPGDLLKSYHYHEYLFQNTWDENLECYVFSSQLQPPSTQGLISQKVQEINSYLMELPVEERISASAFFMQMMAKGGSVDGYTPGLADLTSTLNTVYELINKHPENIVLQRGIPVYAVMEATHTLVRELENLRNAWEQARTAQAQAQAQSLALSNPYIYIDTTTWDQLGSTMRTLGSVNFAKIRLNLLNISQELWEIAGSLFNVLSAADAVISSAEAIAASASSAILNFEMGNVIGGIFATIEAAGNALQTAQDTIYLVRTIITEAQNIYDSVTSAAAAIETAINLIGVEDTIRDLGSYLSDTAQEFELAERQNVALMQKWGV